MGKSRLGRVAVVDDWGFAVTNDGELICTGCGCWVDPAFKVNHREKCDYQ